MILGVLIRSTIDAMGWSEEHWQHIYADREPVKLSWHQREPTRSLALIEQANVPPQAAILDAGGGTSSLAGELVRRGYRNITVADISAAALARARADLGEAATQVEFVVADLRAHEFRRRYDLWHDRAVFHFMVTEPDRDAYVGTVRRTLQPGGHLILATFGPDGPTRCSGLPVHRYGARELVTVLGPEFELLASEVEDHTTPSAVSQQFLWTHWRRDAAGSHGAAVTKD
jgi:ubiquinone/menaquinone biosynthesis C-methylase UbiE